jgi:hypothetical protein
MIAQGIADMLVVMEPVFIDLAGDGFRGRVKCGGDCQ